MLLLRGLPCLRGHKVSVYNCYNRNANWIGDGSG